MRNEYQELLKPEIINSIKGLELISRVVVDSYLAGLNKSRRVGAGQEFSQYRSYEPGDDLRLLDWKMLARSSRYYIKQSEIETNISVKFILDTSRSMLHTEEKVTKMDYARVLIASIGYLAQHQGDALGLFAVSDERIHTLYPRVDKRHFNRFLHQLVQVEGHGRWPEVSQVAHLHDRRHKELIIFVTDMYEYGSELSEFLRKQKTSRNEILVIRLMGRNELELNYSGVVSVEDLETGERIKVDIGDAKSTYIGSITSFNQELRQKMLEMGIGYHLFILDEPLEEILTTFLKRRKLLL